MPANFRESLTIFPPFESADEGPQDKHDSPLDDLIFDGLSDNTHTTMAGHTSPPFIKPEPSNDFFDPNQYMQFSQHQHNHINNTQAGNMNINPATLSNGMSQPNNFMSSSFHMGGAGIADDELLDLDLNQNGQQGNNFDFNQGMQNFLSQQQLGNSANMFSNTPEGAPIQSPFVNEANYGHFRPMPGQQFAGGHSMPQTSGLRSHIQQHIDRKVSDSRSPATPNTPAINNLQGNEDFQQHPGMQPIRHRQHNSMGGGWDSTPSGHSWEGSSPFPSPANGHPIHPQISEVLKNSAHQHKVASSLPTKMEPGTGPGPQAPFSTQEAKRRRRRESHNMVERRRRDNINERIHDLGTLVPQHRLEDEKVRKHLQTNAPLSPSIANATSMSPPNSAMTPGARRPAGPSTGNITQGLPMEEKDKGPNKGDILNGSVAWTKDVMWFLHIKLHQEQELQKLVSDLGGVWPYEMNEDEKRMRSEICEILNKHTPAGGFPVYSRGPGSGLRVPGYTNISGDAIGNDGQTNGHSSIPPLSPGLQAGGSGMSSGGMSGSNQYWSGGDFKEEDEYGMDLQ